MVSLGVTPINSKRDRPITLNAAYSDLRMLFDTGSGIPIWTSGLERLIFKFHKAKLTDYLFRLSGFGGKGSDVPVYILPTFTIKDEDGNLVDFHNLHIAIWDHMYPFDIILSYNMFSSMRLIFDLSKSPIVQIDNSRVSYIAQIKPFLPKEYILKAEIEEMGLQDRQYLREQIVLAQDDTFSDGHTSVFK